MTTDELKNKGQKAANDVSDIVNYSGGALRRTKRKSRTARRSKKTRNAHRR